MLRRTAIYLSSCSNRSESQRTKTRRKSRPPNFCSEDEVNQTSVVHPRRLIRYASIVYLSTFSVYGSCCAHCLRCRVQSRKSCRRVETAPLSKGCTISNTFRAGENHQSMGTATLGERQVKVHLVTIRRCWWRMSEWPHLDEPVDNRAPAVAFCFSRGLK